MKQRKKTIELAVSRAADKSVEEETIKPEHEEKSETSLLGAGERKTLRKNRRRPGIRRCGRFMIPGVMRTWICTFGETGPIKP